MSTPLWKNKLLIILMIRLPLGLALALRLCPDSGTGHPFGGIAKFLASILRQKLRTASCMCGSTDQVIEQLQELRISAEHRTTVRMAKLDVKDFYMMVVPAAPSPMPV